MPKHSQKSREYLINRAFKLLDQGFSQKIVAERLDVHLRTLQRWMNRCNYQKPSTRIENALVEIPGKATSVNVQQIEQPEADVVEAVEGQRLYEYYESQRMLALQMVELTDLLTPMVKAVIQQSNPIDIPVRSVPSLIRAITDLADTSSDCWARATGLEEVLNVIQTISNRQAQAGTESSNNSSTEQNERRN